MCCEYVCAVQHVDVRCKASMCVNLPWGLYLGATQKELRFGVWWCTLLQASLAGISSSAYRPCVPYDPSSHTMLYSTRPLISTSFSGVKCRSGAVGEAHWLSSDLANHYMQATGHGVCDETSVAADATEQIQLLDPLILFTASPHTLHTRG